VGGYLAKTKVSCSELAYIFIERLRAFEDCPSGAVVAIVPDQNAGWRGHNRKAGPQEKTHSP
jgi:hypothetical protein